MSPQDLFTTPGYIALREFPFFLGRFMTQVEHDISDFEEAGEAVPGGVPERQWHHHVEDDEL